MTSADLVRVSDFMASSIPEMIGLITAAGVLVSTMHAIKKVWERQFIERVCIGGPMD